jgi:hypothetical protein
MLRCRQNSSNSAMNSLPPSTWMALKGNGARASMRSKLSLAVMAVALARSSARPVVGDDVDQAEVLEMGSGGEAGIEGVEMAEVTELGGHVVAGLAPTVVTQELAAASSDDAWRLVQEAAAPVLAEDAADHRLRDLEALPAQENHQLLLAPARELLAEVEDRLGLA